MKDLKYNTYEKKQPIIEISKVIQGEAGWTGKPCFLIRTTGCVMRCCWGITPCDSWYTSHKPEKGNKCLGDLVEAIRANPQIRHMFLTGGSPSMHLKLMTDINIICENYGIKTAIETEGSTIFDEKYDYVVISPKLTTSIPTPGLYVPTLDRELTEKDKVRHEKYRWNPEAIKHLLNNNDNVELKFVCNDKSDWFEIQAMQHDLGVPNSQIWLMPMGATEKQLQSRRKWIERLCIDEGYNYTDRLHIIIHGDKRGV